MAFWSKEPPPPAAPQCSFCGKPQREVKKLIAGPNVMICDRCIGLCNDIVVEDETKRVVEPIADARASLIWALERAMGSAVAVRRRVVEALLALADDDAATREVAHAAFRFGDPGGTLLALATIPAERRTAEDAIYEAYAHHTLGDAAAASAVLAAFDASSVSEATRLMLPLHRPRFRFSEGSVPRDEAEQHAKAVIELRARLPSLGLDEGQRRRVEGHARLVDAYAAHALGHLARAEAMLREHLLTSERDAAAWALLFEIHAAQGNAEHARAARERALALVDASSRIAEKLRERSVGPFR